MRNRRYRRTQVVASLVVAGLHLSSSVDAGTPAATESQWTVKAVFSHTEPEKACSVIVAAEHEGFYCTGDAIETNVLLTSVQSDHVVISIDNRPIPVFMAGAIATQPGATQKSDRGLQSETTETQTERQPTLKPVTTSQEEDRQWFDSVFKNLMQPNK